MNKYIEIVATILSVIIAIVGLATAIIKLKEAYIKKRNKEEGKTMEDNIQNINNVSNPSVESNVISSTDSNILTINGDVKIDSSPKEDHQKISTDENILLQDTYTSLFVEKGEIHSEKIKIKHLGNGKIEGKVYLDDTNTYILSGTYRNKILTGEFTTVGKYTDERGTINLKLISKDILSGFCSFSKSSLEWEDQIRVSPYVWVAGSNSDIVNGTYEFCTHCHNEGKKCCCASPDIDMPILLYNEAQKYQSLNPRHQRMRDFSHSIGNTSVRQMNYSKDETKHCHFFDIAENRCKIYNIRPTDCRLFPFDIKLNPNTNEYWVGYYDEVCERKLPDKEKMKQYAHILRPQLFLLFPYANTINKSEVCEQLNKTHFEELYKLHDFIF